MSTIHSHFQVGLLLLISLQYPLSFADFPLGLQKVMDTRFSLILLTKADAVEVGNNIGCVIIITNIIKPYT
jgi:hypothetical protein